MIKHRYRWAASLVLSPAFFTIFSGAAVAAPSTEESSEEAEPSPADESEPAAAPPPKSARSAPPEAAGPVEPPQPPPPNAAPIPATAVSTGDAPAPQVPGPYIQHLGPESFPGRLRGLYGGSLWLEPSFHGLQWPYMARTGIGVSGSAWLDSGREQIMRSDPQLPNSALWYQQGRGVVRVTPTYAGDGVFVQGQIELVGNLCQSAGATNIVCGAAGTFNTDDLWIRFGQWNRWDLKVGRFEAWEIYHLGMGMEPYTFERLGARNFGVQALEAPLFYGVTYLHDRPSDGLATGYAALHVYPSDWLRLELLGKLGTDNNFNDNSSGDTATTSFGGRPAAILDVGWLKVKVGAEYQKRVPITQTVQPGVPAMKVDAAANIVQKGFGGSVQLILNPFFEFGVSAGVGDQHRENGLGQVVATDTFSTKSAGAFANLRVCDLCLLGLGVHYTAQTNSVLAAGSTVNDFTSQLQGFAALQYLLAGQLFIKPELAYSRAYFQPSDTSMATWTNTMYNVRVRLMYLF